MKTAREVVNYCYSHGHIISFERRAIAIKDLDKIENENKDLLDLARNIALGVDVDVDSVKRLVEEIDNK
jgi:hypothetical protein